MSNSIGEPGSSSNATDLLPALDSSSSSPSPPPPEVQPGGGSPPTKESASPPSSNDVSPPPPPPSASLSSPPPASNSPPPSPPPSSPPPSNSNSSPPPSPPLASNAPPSNSQPPLQSSPPTSLSPPPKSSPNSPPPPPSVNSSPPPTPEQHVSPPSPEQSSPPPADKTPTSPPPAGISVSPPSGALQQSPPAPAEFTPPPSIPVSNVPPKSSGSNSPPSKSDSPPISGGPASRTSPDTKNSEASSSPSGKGNDSSENTQTKAAVGVVVASVLLIALVAFFFVMRRGRKRRARYASHYMPTNNFSVKADAYYYGQQPHSVGYSGPMNHSYGSQPPHSSLGDSYGSQIGNMYNGGGPDSSVISGSKTFFSYDELMEITNGFSRQNIIGEGGFGCVYKGQMSDGKVVAVKQLKAGSGQGDREFKAEVEIISRVHHRHLVSLVGYCISDHRRLLIYEFVPNNTLDFHLHAKGLPVLDWPKRLKIAIGSAKGLAYLHEDCHPKIIHRDIKSANILLDDTFEAQVADFGLAKLNDTTQTHVSTRVMGTFGYLAPEYASSGKLTDRSDVFSFGVVLLELITGRKPVDPTQPLGDESLVEWARPILIHALETGDLAELVDPRLEKHFVESEMFRMVETAAACVRHSAPKRPRMVQVVRALDSEGEMSDLSNGVKYGQSTVYDSGQYNQDIMKFRRMALGSDASGEFGNFSGEYNSRDMSRGLPTSSDYTSGESETRAMNHGGRRFP